MKSNYWYVLLILVSWACNNIEDVEPAEKNTFIRFYEGAVTQQGVMSIADTQEGYIVAGNIQRENSITDVVIIKCDKHGNKIWESVLTNSTINAIKAVEDGYLIIGDSIEYNPSSDIISEIDNSHARLTKMDFNGNIVMEYIKSDSIYTNTDTLHVDFHGSAIEVDADGNIYVLGSFKGPLANNYERSFVAVLAPSFNLQWSQTYHLQDRDYRNCRTLYLLNNNNDLLWATTSYKASQNLASAYLSIVYAEANSTFKNNDLYGENDSRNHIVYDMHRSGMEYGVIGTYAENNGASANIYFVRVDVLGNVVPGSERYFDGGNTENMVLSFENRNVSLSQDKGSSITATSDGGYVLAGSVQSIPGVGNGGEDVLLIKVDVFGNMIWNKLIGGSGDETVSSIRETKDKGLLICGTNTVNGLSSIFLMKTDKNGELTN